MRGTALPRIGDLGPGQDPRELNRKQARALPFTPPFNLTGQPAISLPLVHTADGLPLGMQLVGRYADEAPSSASRRSSSRRTRGGDGSRGSGADLHLESTLEPAPADVGQRLPAQRLTWPWSQELLARHAAHLSEAERDLVLHDNVAELYGVEGV